MTAAELKTCREASGDSPDMPPAFGEQLNEFRQLVKNLEFKPAQLIIRAKVDTYTMGTQADSENKVRYYVAKKMPFDLKEENKMLLERLGVYSQKR